MFDIGNCVMVAAGTNVMTQTLLHIQPGRTLAEQHAGDAPTLPYSDRRQAAHQCGLSDHRTERQQVPCGQTERDAERQSPGDHLQHGEQIVLVRRQVHEHADHEHRHARVRVGERRHIQPGRTLAEQHAGDAPTLPYSPPTDRDAKRLARRALAKTIARGFVGSVPFDVYMLMIVLTVAGWSVPTWLADVQCAVKRVAQKVIGG